MSESDVVGTGAGAARKRQIDKQSRLMSQIRNIQKERADDPVPQHAPSSVAADVTSQQPAAQAASKAPGAPKKVSLHDMVASGQQVAMAVKTKPLASPAPASPSRSATADVGANAPPPPAAAATAAAAERSDRTPAATYAAEQVAAKEGSEDVAGVHQKEAGTGDASLQAETSGRRKRRNGKKGRRGSGESANVGRSQRDPREVPCRNVVRHGRCTDAVENGGKCLFNHSGMKVEAVKEKPSEMAAPERQREESSTKEEAVLSNTTATDVVKDSEETSPMVEKDQQSSDATQHREASDGSTQHSGAPATKPDDRSKRTGQRDNKQGQGNKRQRKRELERTPEQLEQLPQQKQERQKQEQQTQKQKKQERQTSSKEQTPAGTAGQQQQAVQECDVVVIVRVATDDGELEVEYRKDQDARAVANAFCRKHDIEWSFATELAKVLRANANA